MVFLWLVLYWIVGLIAITGFITVYYYRLYCRGCDTGVLMTLLLGFQIEYLDSLVPVHRIFHIACDALMFILAWPIKIVWFYFAWLRPIEKTYIEAHKDERL